MEALNKKLNLLLANLQVQRANIQAAHWNLRGCHAFITFHNYFGELYEYNSTHIDMIAEFIRIYRGNPIITFSKYVRRATVEEIEFEDTKDVDLVINKAFVDNSLIIPQIQEIFDISTKELDVGDYMATMLADYGKRQWFLRSSMKEQEEEENEEEAPEEAPPVED